MFFKSLLYPKIKRNDKYISNIKLDKIVVIQNNENLDNINSFYEKKNKILHIIIEISRKNIS